MTERLTGDALEARIKELESERDKLIAETPYEWYGPKQTSHGKIRKKYNVKIGFLRKHGVESPMLVQDIANKAANTVREHLKDSTYRAMRQRKIQATTIAKYGSLEAIAAKSEATKRERYGVGGWVNYEQAQRTIEERHGKKTVAAKSAATKQERYGYRGFNCKKSVETKLAIYGNKSGNVEQAQATKREHYGAGGYGNYEKVKQTKLERYGYVFYNMTQTRKTIDERYGGYEQIISKAQQTKIARYGSLAAIATKAHKTKLLKYGNVWGSYDKIKATNLERYGVEYTCLSEQCIAARGKCQSNINAWWHAKLLECLDICCTLEHRIIRRSYDLQYADKLLIEINPTFTHNVTRSYAFATGISMNNKTMSQSYHYDKTMLAIEHGFDCITIWDWDNVDFAMQCIKAALNGDIDTTKECIDIDLSKEPLLQYLNAGYEIADTYVQKHWHNMKTHVHFVDKNFERQPLLDKGFVEVYDCGHAILQRKQ